MAVHLFVYSRATDRYGVCFTRKDLFLRFVKDFAQLERITPKVLLYYCVAVTQLIMRPLAIIAWT